MPVSPAPLVELPDTPPLNYFFHHHLGINLLTQAIWFQEAAIADNGTLTSAALRLPLIPVWKLRFLGQICKFWNRIGHCDWW